MTEQGQELQKLFGQKIGLELQIEGVKEQAAKMIEEIDLYDVASLSPGVQAYKVWGHGALSVALLVNKNTLSGCGILLWGVQFASKINTLALKIDEFEAQFMVFDGQPGGHDFAILRGASPDAIEEMFKNIRQVCAKEGTNYVFVKNAGLMMDLAKIYPGKEFREISEFYMMIARRDGSVIPQFSFIDPQNSSAFWNNNG